MCLRKGKRVIFEVVELFPLKFSQEQVPFPNQLKPIINKCFSQIPSERPTVKEIIDQWPFVIGKLIL